MALVFLFACGRPNWNVQNGGDADAPKPVASIVPVAPASVDAPPLPAIPSIAIPPIAATSACARGSGRDYQVGPGAGQLATIGEVPWNSLGAGDTVRIFWRPTPYKEKFLITGHGSKGAPIRVCGVKGPNGERPIIDGKNATTGSKIDFGTQLLFQSRNVIIIKGKAGDYEDRPEYIEIEGLEITGQHATYSFKDNTGTSRPYDKANFGACLWIERGHHVVVRDNVIHDCTNGIFSRSIDPDRPGNEFLTTKDLLISRNSIYDCGVVGGDHEHTSYIQSIGVVYELNHYGPLRAGAKGGALKDRSVGTVVRYNFIEDGARSLDLVEAEDFGKTATANPAYRTTFVYGNVIRAKGPGGTAIHYGGDHYGAKPTEHWGEPLFRKGTLYFFNNTVLFTGTGSFAVFDLATTDERAEVFNNVFYGENAQIVLRGSWGEGDSPTYVAGGKINLGRNWIKSGWLPNHASNPLAGSVLTGTENVIVGADAPIDSKTFAPVAGSPIIDRAMPLPPVAAPYVVEYEWDPTLVGAKRTTKGAAPDLGAIEAK